jgi:NTE family protein
MAANLPLDLVLQEALDTGPAQRVTCFAADLFPLAAPLPRGLLQAAQRQSDLMFASQTSQTLQALSRLWDGREPGADLFLAQYEALADETALKGFDFSAGTIEQRQAAGQRDMLRLVERWRSLEQSGAGLHIYRA